MDLLIIVGCLGLILFLLFRSKARPKLAKKAPKSLVPEDLTIAESEQWLANQESKIDHITQGAEARIFWSVKGKKTALSILYVHGFSACRQEISPVPETLGDKLSANLICARLAGHGLRQDQMLASAEDWLQSVTDAWEIASRLGDKVIIIAVSTGAPLSIWLTQKVANPSRVHSLIFMSPNFGIRNPFGFILTWPWSEKWVPKLMGKSRQWEPENDQVAKYWSNQYPMQAVIEMQKVVDWTRHTSLRSNQHPLATLYMTGDPTISHKAAVAFHENWQSTKKLLVDVPVDPANVQHVFAGKISAPQRVDWTIRTCLEFIRSI